MVTFYDIELLKQINSLTKELLHAVTCILYCKY